MFKVVNSKTENVIMEVATLQRAQQIVKMYEKIFQTYFFIRQ